MGRVAFIHPILIIVLVSLTTGCEYEAPGQPFRYPTVALSGTITLNSKPIKNGWITVMPVGATIGDHRIVPVNDDGTYTFRDAPIGKLALKVRISDATRQEFLATVPASAARNVEAHLRMLAMPNNSLSAETFANQSNRHDFDLVKSN